jgi:ABC-type uncharacterized transport system permease subunit
MKGASYTKVAMAMVLILLGLMVAAVFNPAIFNVGQSSQGIMDIFIQDTVKITGG